MRAIVVFIFLSLILIFSVNSAEARTINLGDKRGERILSSEQKIVLEQKNQTKILEEITKQNQKIVQALEEQLNLSKRQHEENKTLMIALIKQLAKNHINLNKKK